MITLAPTHPLKIFKLHRSLQPSSEDTQQFKTNNSTFPFWREIKCSYQWPLQASCNHAQVAPFCSYFDVFASFSLPYLCLAFVECLAATQHERNSVPALILDKKKANHYWKRKQQHKMVFVLAP